MKKWMAVLLLVLPLTVTAEISTFKVWWDQYPIPQATVHVECEIAGISPFAEKANTPATVNSLLFDENVDPGQTLHCRAWPVYGTKVGARQEVGSYTRPFPDLPPLAGLGLGAV